MTTSVAPPPFASPAHPAPTLLRGPLFGGYTVVAVVAAWLVGIALGASDILSPRIAPWTWLALSGACAMLATLAALLAPRRVGALYVVLRLLLMGAMLGAFLALGAARTAWSDPAADPTSVARYANGYLCACAARSTASQICATAPLDFLDVGPGGEATLLRLPSGVTALVNGGPDGTSLAAARASRLPFYQRSLDLLVLADPREGDARGLEDAAGRFGVAQAADAGMLHPTSEYIAWLDALKRHGASRAQIRQGDALWLEGQSRISVLAPPQDLYPDSSDATTTT